MFCGGGFNFIFSSIFFIFLVLFNFLFFIIILLFFVCCLFVLFCLFLVFLPHSAAFRVLVPRPAIGLEPLRGERRIQATGLTENFRLQRILIGVTLPGVLILAPRPGSNQQPANSSAGCLRPNNHQDRNTALPINKNEITEKYVTDEGAR